jgi:hypothetical protein
MNQDYLHQVLTRAQEIDAHQSLSDADGPELDGLLRTADEIGIKRDSVLQALRERITVIDDPLEPGDLIFARLPDGCYYPSTVVEQKGGAVAVKFMNGSEATVQDTALHRFRGLPNEVIYCDWNGRGLIRCAVKSYDPEKQMVCAYGPRGQSKWFVASELGYKEESTAEMAERTSQSPWLYAAIGLASFIVGVMLTWLSMRS